MLEQVLEAPAELLLFHVVSEDRPEGKVGLLITGREAYQSFNVRYSFSDVHQLDVSPEDNV